MIEFWKHNAFGMLNVFMFDKALTKNKHLEVQLSQYLLHPWMDISCSAKLNPEDIHFKFSFCGFFSIDFSFTRKCDHAGLRIEIDTTFGFFIFTIYDTRHWDHQTGNYVKYNQGETNDYAAGKTDRPVSENSTVQKRKKPGKKPRRKSR